MNDVLKSCLNFSESTAGSHKWSGSEFQTGGRRQKMHGSQKYWCQWYAKDRP